MQEVHCSVSNLIKMQIKKVYAACVVMKICGIFSMLLKFNLVGNFDNSSHYLTLTLAVQYRLKQNLIFYLYKEKNLESNNRYG